MVIVGGGENTKHSVFFNKLFYIKKRGEDGSGGVQLRERENKEGITNTDNPFPLPPSPFPLPPSPFPLPSLLYRSKKEKEKRKCCRFAFFYFRQKLSICLSLSCFSHLL